MAIRRPNSSGIRGPQAPQRNGNFLNPPRYPEVGGATSPASFGRRTDIAIEPPNRGPSPKLPGVPKGQE